MARPYLITVEGDDGSSTPHLAAYHGKPCPYCHVEMLMGTRYFPTRDHVHPRAKGGRLTDVNRLIVCNPCNNAKADMTLEQFATWLTAHRDARASIVWALVERTAPRPGQSPSQK